MLCVEANSWLPGVFYELLGALPRQKLGADTSCSQYVFAGNHSPLGFRHPHMGRGEL